MHKFLVPFVAALMVTAGAHAQTMATKPGVRTNGAVPTAQNGQAVPAALRRALVEYYGAGDPYAAAQVNGSDFWVVYLERRGSCGSGGCRAKIWKKVGDSYQYLNSIAVGALPIVQLPTSTKGMPDLGVTQFNNGKPFLVPVPFEGASYSDIFSDKTIPAGRGVVLIDVSMLKPLR